MMKMAPVIQSLLSAICVSAAAAPTNHDAAIVREKIEAGARSCMAGKPEAVMTTYARDIRLQYPGIPDQGYNELLEGYRHLCGSGEGTVASTVPTFEEIYVSGKIAIARLTWTTHLRGMPAGTFRYLRDMQIWEKRKGEWRFVRGVHFPTDKVPMAK